MGVLRVGTVIIDKYLNPNNFRVIVGVDIKDETTTFYEIRDIRTKNISCMQASNLHNWFIVTNYSEQCIGLFYGKY